ncbi:hypothetical protein U27_02367 [Candidatus Vecturithrix granuli]|uniref:Uncharacterized protein n=1 Tax=Vecturithrix granuli TaxID=1499967 RepID=A0A0S6W782_VECG1|nr:hypothetical protein U27_02367 [Candidatus Vecturithrix granuli]
MRFHSERTLCPFLLFPVLNIRSNPVFCFSCKLKTIKLSLINDLFSKENKKTQEKFFIILENIIIFCIANPPFALFIKQM